ncbi:FKBP-type peptidyl-prolyl cis-trans isomerase [Sphingomonas sp.]|uniref:FKBP-type peptidyl-prolyl cis-trans isomerase n=1 Tax=Sphingomonas sp. TaxID=28214 RepID=UPI00286E488D|nr:FKBP-type peptidyl-prolyl cis-trans isomerase [Sphingomonas sp.]
MKTVFFTALALLLAACATVPPPPPAPPETVAGPDFLTRNAAAKGVVTTASGLQYFVVKSGPPTGVPPTANDVVNFDYEGRLTTGEKFDSSFDRGTPLSGPANGFVPGFTEALTLMRPGDEWVVWIPPALGYGAEASGPIPANSVLRFRLALHSVTPTAARTP